MKKSLESVIVVTPKLESIIIPDINFEVNNVVPKLSSAIIVDAKFEVVNITPKIESITIEIPKLKDLNITKPTLVLTRKDNDDFVNLR